MQTLADNMPKFEYLTKAPDNPTVYGIYQGQKYPIQSMEELAKLGFTEADIQVKPTSFLAGINVGGYDLSPFYVSQAIPFDTITQKQTLLPAVQSDTALADLVASGTAGYADYLKLYSAPTETSKQYDLLTQELMGLLPELSGRGAAQLAAEQAAGIPELSKQLAELNAQMLAKVAEYDALSKKIAQQQIPTAYIYGQQAHLKNAMASELGLLQARALGLQGQYEAAQNMVNRAIDLKYQDLETRYNIKLKQLSLLEGKLNKEEQARANALEAYIQQQRLKLQEQKENQRDALIFAINNGITKPYFMIGGNIYRTSDGYYIPTPAEAIKLGVDMTNLSNVDNLDTRFTAFEELEWSEPYMFGGDWVQKNLRTGQIRTVVNMPSGNIPSGQSGKEKIFTNTQINKGTAAAGISREDFLRLDVDTQIYFIERADEIDAMRKIITEAKEMEEDPTQLEQEISESYLPPAVKDTLVRYLWQVFKRPEIEKEEPPPPPPWWQFWK